jgi:HAD superfamily hydrolase (TIGR01549 family)
MGVLIMFFSKQKVVDGDIVYLCEYVPWSRCMNHDKRSSEFVLAFKNKDPYMIKLACQQLVNQIGGDFALAAVPSSKVSNNGMSACHELIRSIITDKKSKGKGLIDASGCLWRIQDMPAQHEQKGKRNPQILYDTLTVQNPELINGKDVLVIDDISTSGNSFMVARDLLKQAGAKSVVGMVVGKTITNENLKYGFIFDLDQTLFDTSSIDDYRNSGDWETAIRLAKDFSPYDGIEALFGKIRGLGYYDLCIVTSSPRPYAEVLARKLQVPFNRLIAYHDTGKHKPDPEPYFKAKQIMQIYDPCIVVFGDTDEDIIPAKQLGMTSVFAGWGGKKPSERADFSFESVDSACQQFDRIIQQSKEIQGLLCR